MDLEERIGALLGGRYRIRGIIGAGGMGAVYLAEHEVLQRPFAVKILRPDLATEPKLVQRFLREARATSRIQHPSIVYISDFGQADDGSLYLVMEYIPGQSLREELRHHGPLELDRALKVLVQIADALDYAHRAGVVHRDLKPDNLMLTERHGKPDFVKVLDFGVAKMLDPEATPGVTLTARGELFGTPEYMAPEQIQGGTITTRSDIYSFGVVAYELATGAPPFRGGLMELVLAHTRTPPTPPSERRPQARIPPAFDAIVARCLAKKPDERYATALEVKEALQRLRRILAGQSPAPTQYEDTDASSPLRLWSRLHEPFGGERQIATSEHVPDAAEARPGEALERTVRDLAEGLRDFGLGSPEITVVLTRLLQAEERVYAEQAELALVESQAAETDQTIDERAGRLRYAAIQLSQERARLTDGGVIAMAPTLPGEGRAQTITPPAANEIDLEAHLVELEARMAAIEQERRQRIVGLESRAEAHRRALTSWTEEVAAEAGRLLALVLEVRPQVRVLELLHLYRRLDELRRGST